MVQEEGKVNERLWGGKTDTKGLLKTLGKPTRVDSS